MNDTYIYLYLVEIMSRFIIFFNVRARLIDYPVSLNVSKNDGNQSEMVKIHGPQREVNTDVSRVDSVYCRLKSRIEAICFFFLEWETEEHRSHFYGKEQGNAVTAPLLTKIHQSIRVITKKLPDCVHSAVR